MPLKTRDYCTICISINDERIKELLDLLDKTRIKITKKHADLEGLCNALYFIENELRENLTPFIY